MNRRKKALGRIDCMECWNFETRQCPDIICPYEKEDRFENLGLSTKQYHRKKKAARKHTDERRFKIATKNFEKHLAGISDEKLGGEELKKLNSLWKRLQKAQRNSERRKCKNQK